MKLTIIYDKSLSLRLTIIYEEPLSLKLTMHVDQGQTARTADKNASNTASPPPPTDQHVDIRVYEQVAAAMAQCDVAVICSVIREHPVLAFEVNCGGVYNACKAAVEAGHARLINTGPKEVR